MAGAKLLTALFAERLEAALGAALKADPAAREAMIPLAGKTIGLQLKPFGPRLTLHFSAGVVHLLEGEQAGTHALISGSPPAFIRSALNGDSRDMLFSGELTMEGDGDLARRFQDLLKRLRLNWEGRLGEGPGGALALRLLDSLGAGRVWLDAFMDSNLRDVSEYLREESRELPGKTEADGLLRDVDAVRSDCDRLEARIARLEAGASVAPVR
jgi:ubiquinone biosynthesis accessory factor UbiJ